MSQPRVLSHGNSRQSEAPFGTGSALRPALGALSNANTFPFAPVFIFFSPPSRPFLIGAARRESIAADAPHLGRFGLGRLRRRVNFFFQFSRQRNQLFVF